MLLACVVAQLTSKVCSAAMPCCEASDACWGLGGLLCVGSGMLLFPVMKPRDAISISGTERFSMHRGYAFSLQYGSDYRDTTRRIAVKFQPDEATVVMSNGG